MTITANIIEAINMPAPAGIGEDTPAEEGISS